MAAGLIALGHHGVHAVLFQRHRFAHGGGRAHRQDAQFAAPRQHVRRDAAEGKAEHRPRAQHGFDLRRQRIGLRAGMAGASSPSCA